jgi:hypothetical protein
MDRRRFLRTTAIAGAGLVLSPASSIAAPKLAPMAPDGARRGGCLWGAHAEPKGNQTARTAITDLEGEIERTIALSRHYVKWDYELPDGFQAWSVEGGRIPYISWHAVTLDGATVPWGSIADGEHDDWIRHQARALRQAEYRMYFCFHHEPEDDLDNGGPAEFAAAYSRIRDLFRSEDVRNLRWVVTLMASTYRGGHGGPEIWMPSSFRLCGVDGYNRYPCDGTSWRPFKALFRPARRFARSIGKGLFIGEYGCVEDHGEGQDSGAKAEWFRQAGATMKAWPDVEAAIYSHVFSERYGCAYWVDTSQSSLEAFTEVGLDPYFT